MPDVPCLPTAAVADQMLSRANKLGYGYRDIAAVHDVLAQLSPATIAAN